MKSCLMTTAQPPQLLAKPDIIEQILTVGEALVAGSYRSPKTLLTTCQKVKLKQNT